MTHLRKISDASRKLILSVIAVNNSFVAGVAWSPKSVAARIFQKTERLARLIGEISR